MATQYLTIIIPPAIATLLSGWLRDTKLPSWLDTIIAYLVVLITAMLWALIAGKLVGDLPVDTVVVAAYTAALIAGPMAALHAYLTVKWPSPIADLMGLLDPPGPPSPLAAVSPRVTLPTTPGLIQRNSLLTDDPTWKPTVAGPAMPPAPLQVPSVDPGMAQKATGPLNGNGSAEMPNESQGSQG